MADTDTNGTPMLDELEKGPWPSFVTEIKYMADAGNKMCQDCERRSESAAPGGRKVQRSGWMTTPSLFTSFSESQPDEPYHRGVGCLGYCDPFGRDRLGGDLRRRASRSR